MVENLGLETRWVELPVDLETFVESPFFLGHPPLSKIQLDAVGATSEIFDIEAAHDNPKEVIWSENQYIEAVIVWGKGAGKDACSMIILSRILYLLGCLANPHEILGTPEHSSIDLLNMALGEDQAKGRFFAPWKRLLAKSPWFMKKLRVKLMSDSVRVPPIVGYDEDMGDMYAINAWSGNSSQEGWEGLNLFACVLDEIDAFRSLRRQKGGAMKVWATGTAESLYNAMTSSAQSRFPGRGRVVLISWPRYKGSFIERRLSEGKKEPTVFTSGPHAVWEVHPLREEHEFEAEFRRNPERARAMYAAQPGAAIDRYFTNTLAVMQAFHARQTDEFKILRSDSDPGPEPPVDYETMMLVPSAMSPPDSGALHCWHIDLSLTKCRAGVAMAHHVGYMGGLEDELLPVIQLDMVYWWEAPEGMEIEFAEIRRFILSFANAGYRTGVVTLDGFQSADTMQILRHYDQYGHRLKYGRDGKPTREPIDAGHLSLDSNMKGYDTLKEVVYEPGRLRAFFCPLLVEELVGLVSVQGRKVDHLDTGSKDVSDAVAGAVYNAVNNQDESLMQHRYRSAGAGLVIAGGQRKGQWSVDDKEISPTGIIGPDGKLKRRTLLGGGRRKS